MLVRWRRWALASVLVAACAPPRAPLPPGTAAAPDEIETTLFLIGDAGEPVRRGDPVLAALRRAVADRPERTIVAFLGDNIYPRGMPPEGASDRRDAERRINAQLAVVAGTGARGIFVPGNHDWARGERGWDAVRRQGAYVAARGDPRVTVVPPDGCPGPVVEDAGARVRLIILDTQWWLHEGPKPRDPTSSCSADSEDEVTAALREATKDAGDRNVIVARAPSARHRRLARRSLHVEAASLSTPRVLAGPLDPASRHRLGVSRLAPARDLVAGHVERREPSHAARARGCARRAPPARVRRRSRAQSAGDPRRRRRVAPRERCGQLQPRRPGCMAGLDHVRGCRQRIHATGCSGRRAHASRRHDRRAGFARDGEGIACGSNETGRRNGRKRRKGQQGHLLRCCAYWPVAPCPWPSYSRSLYQPSHCRSAWRGRNRSPSRPVRSTMRTGSTPEFSARTTAMSGRRPSACRCSTCAPSAVD